MDLIIVFWVSSVNSNGNKPLNNLIYQKNQKNSVNLNMIELQQAKANETTGSQCCEVEAIVSFDDRGQLVFPKELRKKFNLKAGEKFAMVSCTNENGLCCFTLVKTAQINDLVGQALSPMLNNIGKK